MLMHLCWVHHCKVPVEYSEKKRKLVEGRPSASKKCLTMEVKEERRSNHRYGQGKIWRTQVKNNRRVWESLINQESGVWEQMKRMAMCMAPRTSVIHQMVQALLKTYYVPETSLDTEHRVPKWTSRAQSFHLTEMSFSSSATGYRQTHIQVSLVCLLRLNSGPIKDIFKP